MFKSDLFIRLWTHAVGVGVLGGALTGGGVAVVLVFGLRWTDYVEAIAGAFFGGLLGAGVGAMAGFLLGGMYGVVVASVGARALDPYPGRSVVRWVGRVLGISGGLAFDLIAVALGWVRGWTVLLVAPPLVGAWLGTLLVNWLVRESEAEHARPAC